MQLSDAPSATMLADGPLPKLPPGEHGPADPPRRGAARPLTQRIACWSARHRVIALVGWLVMVGGALLAGHVYGTQSQPQYDPGQSGVAERMLHALNVVTPPTETVLIHSREPMPARTLAAAPAMSGDVREATSAVVAALRALPGAATDIQSPFGAAGRHMIAPGGRSALVTFQVAGPHSQADTRVVRALDAVAAVQSRYPGLIVAETGGASVDRAATAMLDRDFHQAELTSVPLTLVLLLLVFGALIAASIPVILAGTAVATTVSLLAIPSRWLPIGQGTSEVVLIIGMAVGIDYTLFYLRREREERAAGASFHDALRTAAATSGRAIVVSGLTVMISLAGLLCTGIDMFTGFAIGTMLVVGVAVLGSLTALPALLALLGPWADRARVPFLGKGRTRAEQSRLWSAVVGRVVRHPAAWGGLALIALAALAAPALGMRIGQPAINMPSSLPAVQTLEHIQRDFPGGPAPAQVVVTGPGARSTAMERAISGIEAAAAAGGPIHGPVTVQSVGHGRGMLISVPLAGKAAGGSSSPAAITGLRALRGRILPATVGKVHDVSYAVTGSTASRMDYRSALRSASPLVFGIVAALAFVLLLMAFRSLAIPLVSIGLNLLSVGAAYGLITVIFQQGHLEGVLGFTSFGGIIAWVPLFMFVFLFGLSMDYHVFVLSRIAELKSRGMATADAVTGGISRGAGVVTSAAVIMVAVFSIFASLSTVDLKMIGVGLAFAVFIDATVVRGICVPAALALLGERSWYLPAWLRWLPRGISLDA